MSSKITKFEMLLEDVPDALVGMDQKGVIRFVNHQTESLFGYDRTQLIGEPVEKLVPQPLWQIYAQHKDNYFADPRTRSIGLEVQLSGRHQSGDELTINISMSEIDTGDVLLVITAAGDVARQQQAVKSAELLASIVESSQDAIIAITLTGSVTSWNSAAERMYGYSNAEVLGKFLLFLLPDDRLGEMKAVMTAVRDGRPVDHMETVRVRKDGTSVPVSIAVSPIRDEDGAVVGMSAVHRDVTVQRQELAVAQRMASIVENSEDAIIGETLEGVITSWNPAAERMFGYSSLEIVGKSIGLLIPEGQTGHTKVVAARLSAGQRVEHLESFHIRKDGTVFPISLTVSPIRDDGSVVGASVICRDLTERRQAFAVARLMEAIVNSAHDAIISSTLDGIITSWNPAAERMFGYSSGEMIGRPAETLTPKDRAGEVDALLAKIKAGQQVQNLESRQVRKDGTVIPISLTVSPLRDNTAVVGASVICRDLSELKHTAQHA